MIIVLPKKKAGTGRSERSGEILQRNVRIRNAARRAAGFQDEPGRHSRSSHQTKAANGRHPA